MLTSSLPKVHIRETLRKKLFLRGPIPLEELMVAAGISGSAVMVLLLIHHQTAMCERTIIKLPAGLLRRLHVSPASKVRALNALETAGLIQVFREQGRPSLASLVSQAHFPPPPMRGRPPERRRPSEEVSWQ
jgi:hypothetical protein